MTQVAAVICVRMSSERLPGKALCVYDEATGKTNLECIIERVRTSRYNPKVIVATSTDPTDDPIWNKIDSLYNQKNNSVNGIGIFRGDLNNVVRRFDESLKYLAPDADLIWRVMADNPLVDVGLVDWRADILVRNKADVIIPITPEPTYAAQANVWSREAWDFCVKHSSGSLLEHPGELIYERAAEFRAIREPGPESIYYQPVRTELDTPEDLEFFRAAWRGYLGKKSKVTNTGNTIDDVSLVGHTFPFQTKEVLSWLSTRPDIVALNSHIQEKTHSTYLHGHARARNIKCEHCSRTVANKVNDRVDITCAGCGQVKSFYP